MLHFLNRELNLPRRPASEITPTYEDSGLFKTTLCDIMLELIPQTRRNDWNDLIVRGFASRKTEIDVIFAGRRVASSGPLEKQLKSLLQKGRSKASDAAPSGPDITMVRLPLRAEGCWRRSLQRDNSGWETGTYHFVVARWSFNDAEGKTLSFGESPLVKLPR